MPKHTWSFSVKSDAGKGPTISRTVLGSSEQNIGENVLGGSGLVIGVQDVEEVDLAITVANIRSFFIKCDTDIRLRINNELTPAQEFSFNASEGLAWNNINLPQNVTNPLTTNITKFFFYNKGTVDGVTPSGGLKAGNLVGGFILQQESVFS
jgi:hypothetical protein